MGVDNGVEKKNDWLSTKVAGVPAEAREKDDLASRIYAQWMVGYEYEEIAAFFGITEIEVASQLQSIKENLTPRQVIAQNNDRERILLQRDNAQKYRRIVNDSLTMTAAEYIRAGISPVGPMKEYREAVGMTERPGGFAINFNKNTANFPLPGNIHPANISGRGGVRSFEELVRLIIAEDPSCGLQPVMDAEAHEILTPDQETLDSIDDIDEPLEDEPENPPEQSE